MKIKKYPYKLVLRSSVFALVLAYLSELIFDLTPCMLCIYQRIPYFILLLIATTAVLRPSWGKHLVFITIFLYITEIILASYHVGVEHYWIEDTYMCQDSSVGLLSFSEIASSCSEVKFRFMNLSMAEWNLLYAIGFLYSFIRYSKKK